MGADWEQILGASGADIEDAFDDAMYQADREQAEARERRRSESVTPVESEDEKAYYAAQLEAFERSRAGHGNNNQD